MCKACDNLAEQTEQFNSFELSEACRLEAPLCEACSKQVELELAAQEVRTAVDALVERALEALREAAGATLVACLMPLVPMVWAWSAAAAIWGVLWE